MARWAWARVDGHSVLQSDGPDRLTWQVDGPGTIDLSALNYNVAEGGGVGTVTVVRSSATNLSESVDYATVARPAGAGNATAGVDYLTSTGTLTFAPNEMTKTFQVPVLDDSASEGNELVNLSLSNPKNLTTAAAYALANEVDRTLEAEFRCPSDKLEMRPKTDGDNNGGRGSGSDPCHGRLPRGHGSREDPASPQPGWT